MYLIENEIESITLRLDQLLVPNQALIEKLDQVHGIDKKTAQSIIGHRITKAVYHIIKHGKSFVDLGEAYLMSKSTQKRIKALKIRARHLGFNLVPVEAN